MDRTKRILLLGAASYDIQSVANEIAGQVLFPNPASTKDFRVFNVQRSIETEIQLQLTVTPGFMDHRLGTSPKQMKLVIENELQSRRYSAGFQAFLVIMSYPVRWTDEERDTINFTRDVLKDVNLSSCATLVLANGHNFKKKYPDNTLKKFKEYLYLQGSQVEEFQRFLNLFHGRVLILDTELDDQELNGPQLKQFFESLCYDAFAIPDSKIEEEQSRTCWGRLCRCLQQCFSYIRSLIY